MLDAEGAAGHFHAHLDILVNGKPGTAHSVAAGDRAVQLLPRSI
jgi:hypothetical protein